MKYKIESKTEINEVLKLSTLTDSLRKLSIGYSEFNELVYLCSGLSVTSQKDKICDLIKTLGYDNNFELVDNINNYNSMDNANKMKIAEFVGVVLGTTATIQTNTIIKYKTSYN